jgi:hypothetical protein
MADFRKSTAWFALLFIFLVVGLMSLGTCHPTEQQQDFTQVDETMVTEADESEETEVPEEEFVDYSQLASESDPDWVKPPYYHENTASYIPGMYGMIAQNAREDRMDKSFFPSIQGLYFKSCMESCHKDYCKSKRAVLAISCPEKVPLLRWVSDMACDFANGCTDDSSKHISPNNSLKSAKEICDYYIDVARKSFKDVVKVCAHEADLPCEQSGRLIANVWQKGNLHTFVVAGWYDWGSCGDNTAFSYFTVDASTGKVVTYENLIDKSDEDKLDRLLPKYLGNGYEKWAASADRVKSNSGKKLISQMDGCALLKEGLIIFYLPYSIGCGADGEFTATIPYEVLKENGIELKVSI